MPGVLRGLVRLPATWAFVLLGAAGVIAVGDGIRLISDDGSKAKAAAGLYVGAVGIVLLALLAVSIWQSRGAHAADETLVASIADEILDEEREAGRDPSDHFSKEAEPLSVGETVRVLGLAAALVVFWVIGLPYIGFAFATGIFCLLFMRFVTHMRWVRALIGAALIAAILTTLFSEVGVLLPRGSLWPY